MSGLYVVYFLNIFSDAIGQVNILTAVDVVLVCMLPTLIERSQTLPDTCISFSRQSHSNTPRCREDASCHKLNIQNKVLYAKHLSNSGWYLQSYPQAYGLHCHSAEDFQNIYT